MVMSVGWVVCVRNCPCSKGFLWGTAVYEGCFWKGHRLMDPGLIDEGYHCRTRIHLIADVYHCRTRIHLIADVPF